MAEADAAVRVDPRRAAVRPAVVHRFPHARDQRLRDAERSAIEREDAGYAAHDSEWLLRCDFTGIR